MPTEELLVRGVFDPAGITRGVDIGASSMERFEAVVRSIDKSTKQALDVSRLAQVSADAFKQQTAAVTAYEARIKSVLALVQSGPMQGPVAPPIITRDKVRELEILSARLVQSGADARRFATDVKMMNMALLEPSGRRRGLGEPDSWARGMENLRNQNTAAAASFVANNRAANLARAGLVGLTTQALGTGGAFGSLAQSVLFATGGIGAVAAVSVAALAAIKIYEEMAGAARKAREERDRLFGLAKESVGVGPQSGFKAQRAATEQRILDLGKAQAALEADIGRKIGLTVAGRAKQVALEKVITDLAQARITLGQLDDATAVTRARLALDAARQGVDQAQAWEKAATSALASLAKFRADQAALGPQTFGSQPGFVSQEEEGAFARRIQLSQQAAAAEIRLLETARAIEAQRHADGDEEVAAQQGRLNAFAAQIELRKLEGREQVLAIQREAALLEETRKRIRAEQDHLSRVARAGGGNQTQGAGGRAPLPSAIAPIHRGGRPEPDVQIAEEMARARTQARQLAEAMDQVESSTAGAAIAFAGLGQTASQVLNSALAMGQAFSSIQRIESDLAKATTKAEQFALAMEKASAIGNLFQAGLGFAGGVFSAIAGAGQESESDRLMRENNQRLVELRVSLDNQLTGGRLATTAGELSEVRGIIGDPNRTIRNIGDLNDYLAQSGRSVGEWGERLEQMTGLDILDEQGRIIAGSLDAADIAIQGMIADIIKFSDTIDARASQLAQEDKFREAAGGDPNRPHQDLANNRRLILGGLELDSGLEARIASLNLDSADGRAAYLEFLRQLYDMGKAGEFTAEILNDFPSADEVFGELESGVDDIIAANEEAAQAARDLASAAIEAAERFADAFPSLLDLRSQLLGQSDDPATQFADALTGLAFQAPDLAQMFSGIDLNDEAARGALRDKMLAMVETLLGGQAGLDQLGIAPEEFGPFRDFLGIGADILSGFNKSVEGAAGAADEATKSLFNVPTGFNLAALEFQAQAAGGGAFDLASLYDGAALPLPDLGRGATTSNLPGAPGGGGTVGHISARVDQIHDLLENIFTALRPGANMLPISGGGADGQRKIGDLSNPVTININGAGKDSAQLAREIETILQRRNLARTGTPEGRR